ncbi:hypothetical protein SDRG_12360 [Saprolegnia diclina VS20]|uniref:Fungal lipase-type domain-containing protein n=1 Tax=Saprolegnia diclina (strain VS20) TaxID=1156394 RepID=T0PWA6_SAPDV|nr:hypothetical protein SDRG_12360 [Saprolegnia diclina VS20]EQC29814.1 hypothetical protein SDRG_12360 [Saprolegnia diclina VS20]|eukprot:XP_008616653.1 hypothetical protein SDRG_12360 [Saprolegnia diclina VS20]
MRIAAIRPQRPSLATALHAPLKAVGKFKAIIATELLHLAKLEKLLNATCAWKAELLRPPTAPRIRIQVMPKGRLFGVLAVYYVVTVALVFTIVLDRTASTFATPPLTGVSTALLEVSPTTETIRLDIRSSSLAYLDMILLNATGLGTISIYAFPDTPSQTQVVPFESLSWSPSSNQSIVSAPFPIAYRVLYKLKVDLYSSVLLNVSLTDGAPFTIFASTGYTTPYMMTLVGSLLTVINISCGIYFHMRIRTFAIPGQTLPQWDWVQLHLLALLLWICVPYEIAVFKAVTQGVTVAYVFRQMVFWLRLFGKNGCRLAVLLFCDGMATTKPRRAPSFYTKKVIAVVALTAVQGASQSVSSPSLVYPLLYVYTWLEFVVQCVMVLWLAYRRGQRVRRQPYRSATFEYTTYGVMFFLVFQFAIASAYSLIRLLVVAGMRSATDTSDIVPDAQQQILLAGLIRDQMFAWIVLKCYIPLPPSSSVVDETSTAFSLTEASSPSPSVFCLETAVTMLNLSVASYYTSHLHRHHSPSSCGHLGKDIPDLDVLDCTLLAAFHDPATDTNGMLVYEERKQRYVLAFRGTGSIKNAATDLRSRQMRLPGTLYTSERIRKHNKGKGVRHFVHVHSGFYHAYATLERHLHAAIGKIPDDSVVICTGHSLGGALATIAAMELALKRPSLRVAMYNYGSPRVGNHAFQELFNATMPAFRVINDGDIVTQYPKRDYTNVDLDGVCVYKHVGVEITLLCGGNAIRGIIVRPTIVDRFVVLAHRNSLASHSLENYRNSFRSLMVAGTDRLGASLGSCDASREASFETEDKIKDKEDEEQQRKATTMHDIHLELSTNATAESTAADAITADTTAAHTTTADTTTTLWTM